MFNLSWVPKHIDPPTKRPILSLLIQSLNFRKGNDLFFRQLTLFAILVSATIMPLSPANALSCMRPDIARSFQYWSEAKEEYVLVRGVMNATKPLPILPKTPKDINNPTPPSPHTYSFSGALIGTISNSNWKTEVVVSPTCAGPWCASYPESGVDAIMAFEKTSYGYKFVSGPCGGNRFTEDLDLKEAIIRKCLSGKCPEPN